MRDYHDLEGLGDLPAEKLDQTQFGFNIAHRYTSRYRKYLALVRTTIDPDNLDAFQPDVVFFRKDKKHKWGMGKAIVVVEIEDHKDFKKCLARCQEHLAMNPELLEAFAYNMDKKYWVRHVPNPAEPPSRSSWSDVLKLYLKDLK